MPARKISPARREYEKIDSGRRPAAPGKWDPAQYTKIPHEYEFLLRGGKLGGPLQHALMYYIGRHTIGDSKRPEWAKLSLGAMAKACGGAERKNVLIALNNLDKRGVIETRDRTGCSRNTFRMYKWRPDRWKTAPAYEPPTPAEIRTAEAEETPDDEEETLLPAAASAEQVVDPGKSSRPQPVALQLKESPSPVQIRIVYRSEFDFPVSFRCQPGRNGRLQINVKRQTDGENGNSRCSRPQPHPFALPSPSPTENKEVTKYRTYISRTMLNLWGRTPDAKILSDIIESAAGAPFNYFERIASKKFRQRGAADRHTHGLMKCLARDAYEAWQAEIATAAQSQAPETPENVTAADLARLKDNSDDSCQPCNGTGKRGFWERGEFRMLHGNLGGTCQACKGSGKAATS